MIDGRDDCQHGSVPGLLVAGCLQLQEHSNTFSELCPGNPNSESGTNTGPKATTVGRAIDLIRGFEIPEKKKG